MGEAGMTSTDIGSAGPAKLRVGVIGAGSWCVANHLPILASRSDVELVAVARPGQGELAKVRDAFGFTHAFEDPLEMLEAVALDAVVIASPHFLHAEHAAAALAKGCHVMVEKPMATTTADAERIKVLAESSGRVLLVPYGWSFQPYFKAARRMVEQGLVGEIRHVVAQMATPIEELMSGGQLQGTEEEMFRPESATWTTKGSGGYGWGQLVHLLGGLFYLTDLAPREVYALTGNSAIGTDIHDALTVRFDGGGIGVLSGAASLPAGAPFQVDIRVFGTKGVLLLDVERERLSLKRVDGADQDIPIEPGSGAYTCVEPVHAFVDLCLGKRAENCGTATMGLRSVQVVEAMLQSSAAGAPVRIG